MLLEGGGVVENALSGTDPNILLAPIITLFPEFPLLLLKFLPPPVLSLSNTPELPLEGMTVLLLLRGDSNTPTPDPELGPDPEPRLEIDP